MGAWDDHTVPEAGLYAQNIPAPDAQLLAEAKVLLRRRLRLHTSDLYQREGVTETAFYDEVVGDLAADHDVIAELNALLTAAYFVVHFRKSAAAPGNADEARFLLYDRELSREALTGWVGMVRTAIDQEEIVFEAGDTTRDELLPPVTWIA